MPRGQYNRKPKSTSLAVNGVKADILPPNAFSTLTFWSKLTTEERTAVENEGKGLAVALLNYGNSKLAIGEHLAKLRDVLEPHNVFGKFLKNFHFSKRTAYRYINGYLNAKQRLSEPILKMAMARGMNIIGESEQKPLGIYTDAAAALPPPVTADSKQAATYLDQLEDVRRKQRKATVAGDNVTGGPFVVQQVNQNPDTLLRECYRFVMSRYKKLPTAGRIRSAWVHNFCGMLLAELGVGGAQSIAPRAVPEEFRAQRGRPKLAATA